MKEIYKNPVLYYILVPVLIVLWPLLVHMVYLPQTERLMEKDMEQYSKAEEIMIKILEIDPGRLELADSKKGSAKFDYATAVDKAARKCRISPTNYNISSKPARISSGQKSQRAKVVLKEVDILKFAEFLSAIQLRWANLKCEKVTLTEKKGVKDIWKIDLDFKYYY